MRKPLDTAQLPGLPLFRRGKVRDVFDLGDRLLIVASDRISAFDVVLSPGIPDKGRVLTQLSNFWFAELADVIPNHLVATSVADFPAELTPHAEVLEGRSVIARKARVLPIECVVRGYLAGSGWKEYQRSQTVCGIPLPAGLALSSRLPEPIFTPSTKAEVGHDENIDFATAAELCGAATAERAREASLALYARAAEHARSRGIVIADTKFEFGIDDAGELILVDEALTPDSSRFWPASGWQVGTNPPSFDKQYLRDYLERSGWNKEPPAPVLPAEVIEETRARYLEAYRLITENELP